MKVMMICILVVLVAICIGMILLERRISLALKLCEIDEEYTDKLKRENMQLLCEKSILKIDKDGLERRLEEVTRDMQNIPYYGEGEKK